MRTSEAGCHVDVPNKLAGISVSRTSTRSVRTDLVRFIETMDTTSDPTPAASSTRSDANTAGAAAEAAVETEPEATKPR